MKLRTAFLFAFLVLAITWCVCTLYGHDPSSVERSPSDDYVVKGTPTISAAKIDSLLCALYGGQRSSACGTGHALYELGVNYGIDPIYALGFFWHESNFGLKGAARTALNMGNIRCSAGYQCYEGYRKYAAWPPSYEDWYRLIRFGYVQGQISRRCPCVTVAQIIPVYAPSSDGNDEQAYIHSVESSVTLWRQEA